MVVAAAGNHGTGNGAVPIYAPGNDPFVITVGAFDQNGDSATWNDTVAPWSAYGTTADGFHKPELSAPGRYLIMPVPEHSELATQMPERVVAPGYMWMSGTSFAAPVVSGAAAQILALHPDWTPDQVKGALMLGARPLNDPSLTGGVGEVDAAAAAAVEDPPNPNAGLTAFVTANPANGQLVFDSASWTEAVDERRLVGRGELGRGELGRGELGRGELGRGELDRGELDRGELGRRQLDRGDRPPSKERGAPAAQAAGVPRSGDSSRCPALSPNGGCRAPTRRRTFRRTTGLSIPADLRQGRREENGKAAMRVSLRLKASMR